MTLSVFDLTPNNQVVELLKQVDEIRQAKLALFTSLKHSTGLERKEILSQIKTLQGKIAAAKQTLGGYGIIG